MNNCTAMYFLQKCQVLANSFKFVIVSEPQSLPDFVKAHAKSFPVTALVTTGYQSDDGNVGISSNKILHIYSLHIRPVILAMNENRPLPPIPLTTEVPFSVLYNPNNDINEAMQGFVFSDVTSLLSLAHPPKVVCVTKEWTGDSTTISKGEVLVINKCFVSRPHVAAGIVTFSIRKMEEKFLPEECAGNFSTDPKLIQTSLMNIFLYISDPFPLVVYTPKPFKHTVSTIIHLVGCDVIEYFAYRIEGEFVSQLPIHLPDIQLCLIADLRKNTCQICSNLEQGEPCEACGSTNSSKFDQTMNNIVAKHSLLPACSLAPIILSEPQMLPEFIKAHTRNFPVTALVTSGYQSDDGDVEISSNTILSVHSVHTTPVILAMDESRPLPPIPLTTETPFSVLYNPNNDMKEAMQGFVFTDVSSLLSIAHPPKVVCVTKEWTGDSTNISKGEILVINKCFVPGPHVAAGIVTFSISKMEEKFLPEECAGNFGTDPKLIQMSLMNYFLFNSEPFPSVVYTPEPLKHTSSEIIHIVGCDVVQYFAYTTGGELEFQLPVHIPDIQLCLVADFMDHTLPQSIRTCGVKKEEPLEECATLNNSNSDQTMNNTCTKQPILPDIDLAPITLSEPQMLPEFVKAHAKSFPLTALVTSGYQSDDGDVVINSNKILYIHSLHTTPVILAMNENRPIPPIPLTTETPFSVVYNPNNDRKKAMQGFVFSDVSSLLSLAHPPKVVCVTKEWTGDSTTISKGEILVINKRFVPGPHVVAGIVTFSISKMVEKFLPEECDGLFSTTPKLIQMSLENIFAYISNPFPSEVYTQQLLEHLISGFLYLTGCDIIQYLIYSSNEGEMESGQLPVHLPGVKLCLIMDLAFSKLIRSMDLKSSNVIDKLSGCNGNQSMNHHSIMQPPPLPPKSVTRNRSFTMPMDSSAMIPSHTAILSPLQRQPPPLPSKQKHNVHYPSCHTPNIVQATCTTQQVIVSSKSNEHGSEDTGLSTKWGSIGRPLTSEQFHDPSDTLVQMKQHPLYEHDRLVQKDEETAVVIESETGLQLEGSRYPHASSLQIKTRDDTTIAFLSATPSNHSKATSQSLHQWSTNLTSQFHNSPSHGGNLLIHKTAASNVCMYKSPVVTSLLQPGAPETSRTSPNISNIGMYGETLPIPIIDGRPPLPLPVISDQALLASKPQEEPLKYQQDGMVSVGVQQPIIIEGYHQVSGPLTIDQFVSQYSDQLPVSIHLTTAASFMSGQKCLDVIALKRQEVAKGEDYIGKQIEIQLMSPKRFSLLYGTLQGYTVKGVSDFLKLKSSPKVVCVTRSWKNRVMSIDKNEILIIQILQREGVKKGIVTFSIRTRSLKFLPRECTAHFSTNASLLGLPMVDLIGHIPNLFPCKVCSVKSGNMPKYYPNDVITLKEVAVTFMLECVPIHKSLDSTQDSSVLCIPAGLPCVEVVVLEKVTEPNAGLTGEDQYVTTYSVS